MSAADQRIKSGIAAAAHGNARAIGEDGDPGVLRVRLDAGDALDVDDEGTVDAHEAFGVERGFEAGDGLLLEPVAAFTAQGNVVILGLGVVELADRDDVDLCAILDDDSPRPKTWSHMAFDVGL